MTMVKILDDGTSKASARNEARKNIDVVLLVTEFLTILR